MQWALLGVIIGALVLLSGRYPKLAFGILAALLLSAGLLVISEPDTARWARHSISPSEVRIDNIVLQPAYADSYQLHARLVNLSDRARLREAVLSVTMLDCTAASEASCQVIGHAETRLTLSVPPGQARDISHNIYLGASRAQAELRWKLSVTETS